jgi:hypothetical protein
MNSHMHSAHSFNVFTPGFDSARGHVSREQLEARLADLRSQIEDLLNAASTDDSAFASRIRQLLDELLVKQEAICWKLRVAKRFHGEARDAFMADILDSVDRLRSATDFVARAYGGSLQVV